MIRQPVIYIWMFPKIVGEIPANHPILIDLIRFSIINHPFWGTVPLFWKLPYTIIAIWWILLGSKSSCFFHDASGKKLYRGSLLGLENLGVFRGWVVYLINWFICLFVCYWFIVFFLIYLFIYVCFIWLCICLFIDLFVCLFGCLFVCLFVWIYVSFCLTQILINLVVVHFSWSLNQQVFSNYYVWSFPTISNYPRKLQHTPKTHTPGNPPKQLWKESLYSLFRVCSKGVLKQPHKHSQTKTAVNLLRNEFRRRLRAQLWTAQNGGGPDHGCSRTDGSKDPIKDTP